MPCPSSFQNDMTTFRNKDDVLTLLIHLGYLAYNQKRQTAFIPNEEIRSEFASAENNIEKIHMEYVTDYPVLMAELKWNKDAGTALQQIKTNNIRNLLRSTPEKSFLWGSVMKCWESFS